MELGHTFLISIFIIIAGVYLQTIFIITDWKKDLKKAALFKGLAAFCFVLLGGLFVSKNPSVAGWCILPGLFCGMAGDIGLAVKKNLSGKWASIINAFGVLSFMTGHFFYIMGLFYAGIIHFNLGLTLTAVISILVIPFLCFKAKKSSVVNRLVGCIYIFVVISMFSTAAALFAMQKTLCSGLFLTGALLFLISDIVTIYNSLLEAKPKKLRAINLGIYYTAQILISISIYNF